MLKERIQSPPTLETHLKMADLLHTARENMSALHVKMRKFYSKTELKKFNSLDPGRLKQSKFSRLQSELDDSYHSLITDEEFEEYGHIYYGISRKKVLEARAKK